jgi:Golgi nucleoside diphosphatase
MNTLHGILKSWVLWFNGIMLSLMPAFEYAAANYPELHEYIPDNVYKHVGLFIVGVNMALRFKTSKPLKEK